MATTTSTTSHAPPQACAGCGAPLAEDQRYCLNCGARAGEPRLTADEVVAWNGSSASVAGGPPAGGGTPGAPALGALAPQRDWMPLVALGVLATLALVLVVGVLIGKTSSGGGGNAAAPQIVTVSGGLGGGAGTAETSFTSDWDATTDGWTIEIGSLAKDGTQPSAVAAAKSAATGKGVPDVGALDSDQFSSLPGGRYVVYSGSFDSRKAAQQALAKVKSSYPSAKVVHVSQGDAGAGSGGNGSGSGSSSSSSGSGTGAPAPDLSKSTGSDYEKKSQNTPKTQVLPGKPPPKDNKKPGDGTAATEIG